MQVLKKLYLYSCLAMSHIRFWSFPTPEEFYYCQLGDIYFRLKHFTKAITLFKKSEESNNGSDTRYTRYNLYRLGLCFFELGDFKNAVHYFDKYLSANPDDVHVLRASGLCHYILDEFDLAAVRYKHAIDLEPVFRDFLAYITVLYKTSQTNEALKYLEIANMRSTNATEKRILKAISCKVNDELTMAIRELTDILSSSDYAQNHVLSDLSDSYLPVLLYRWQKEAGDLKAAFSTIESFANRYPDDVLIGSMLTLEYADQRVHLRKALDRINGFLLAQPCNSFLLEIKAWICFQMGNIIDAKKLIEQGLELNPNSPEILNKYRIIYDSPTATTVSSSPLHRE